MYFEVLLFSVSIIFIVLCVTYRFKKSYLNFDKLHVVITGGSSGIGYDLSKQAFEKGANISIIARNKVMFI
jgi:3-dehydrosphinganine reductase